MTLAAAEAAVSSFAWWPQRGASGGKAIMIKVAIALLFFLCMSCLNTNANGENISWIRFYHFTSFLCPGHSVGFHLQWYLNFWLMSIGTGQVLYDNMYYVCTNTFWNIDIGLHWFKLVLGLNWIYICSGFSSYNQLFLFFSNCCNYLFRLGFDS